MSRTRSIYKTDEGRDTMATWYQTFVERLGADRISFRTVETRFGQTNVLIGGPEEAPPLWCFHGAMASAPAALAQIPGLLDRFRVHFPDTIGQPGRSDERRLDWQGKDHGDWVVDILDAFGLERIHAVGCSLGGYVLLRTAEVAPERIERAVLWVPGGLIKPSWRPMLGLIGDGLLYALWPKRERLEKILARTFTDIDPDYVDFFGASLKHVHPDRRFPNTLEDHALDGWEAPVLLITHQNDSVFPAEDLERRAGELIPNLIRTIELPDTNHMPPFAEGALDEILEELQAFLSS